MKLRSALLTATLLATPAVAMAQPVDGLYIGAGAGYDYKLNTKIKSVSPDFANTLGVTPAGRSLRGDGGFVGLASVGYGLGNGLRIEVEGDYRFNHMRLRSGSKSNAPLNGYDGGGNIQNYGGFLNALFDFDVGSDTFFPYVGVGAGYQETQFQKGTLYQTNGLGGYALNTNSKGNFAAQGILGVSVALTGVPGLSLTAEGRFMAIPSKTRISGTQNIGAPAGSANIRLDNQYDASALVGLRYAFNTPVPPPPPAPIPAAPPKAEITRTYLVFFDWDRADLTARARQIIAEAANNANAAKVTRIEVSGHADRSGTPAYNQKLSLRRADNVASELVRLGIPKSEIDVMAFGDTHPLVPTAAGVREPQNRRVEIVLK